MFRTVADQATLWEVVLPPEVWQLPVELAQIDALLDDPVFFAPFVPFFDPRIGRPSTPMETYLRLMFLKFRYNLGYESLCREVSDSISWRRFARIGIDQRVPDPTTLMKLTTRCGSVAVAGLNEALLVKAVGAKLVRTAKVSVDTTVVPANVAYPTDSSLLAKAVKRIGVTCKRIQEAGGALRTKVVDRSRAAGRRAHDLNAKLRTRGAQARDDALKVVAAKNGELVEIAEQTVKEAKRLLTNAKRALRQARRQAVGVHDAAAGRRRGRLARAVNDLTQLLEATTQIAAQTRSRLRGVMPEGATRRVSLHDPHARPISKGKLGQPVEFGYKAQVCDNIDGIVLDWDVQLGNPPDAPRLAPCVERVIARTGTKPRTVTADRGYGEAAVDGQLHALGVKHVVIPRRGKPGQARQQVEHSPGFRQAVKWRTGCEGRIAHLKRNYGWNRTRMDSLEGARTWTGHGVFAHNLAKIAALTG